MSPREPSDAGFSVVSREVDGDGSSRREHDDVSAFPVSRSLGHRAGWTLADQALSSLTNAGLSILVARSVSASSFGTFSVALLAFSFAMGLNRALVTDPLVIRFSATSRVVRTRATAQASGAAFVFGAAASAVCGGSALVLRGELATALAALAAVLPFILVQDTWRFAFFAAGRPAAATMNDMVWGVAQFAMIGALISADMTSVALLLLAWGGAALLGAVFGCFQARVWPQPHRTVTWLRTHHDLSTRFAADYVINMGAVNVAYILVAGIAGFTVVGALRAAQVLLGPLQLLFSGMSSLVLPLFSRRVAVGASMLRPAMLTTAVTVSISVAWITALLLLPNSVGVALLGSSWTTGRDVLPASGVTMVMIAGALAAALSLKALSRSGLLLKVTLVQSPLIIALACAGATVFGAVGAAAGLALAQAVGATLCWLAFRFARNGVRSAG